VPEDRKGQRWLRTGRRQLSMAVLVMHVRHVGMCVPDPAVQVRVRVRFAGRIAGSMFVLVVLVMHVGMGVNARFVNVLVLMPFGQMQPNTASYQQGREDNLSGDGLTKDNDCRCGTDKRRRRKIGASPRGTEMP
jgi:hypothetical protein